MFRSVIYLFLLLPFIVTAQEIKAITFNIRFATERDKNDQWAFRKTSVRDFLAYESPDFIGLQEALLSQIQDIDSGQVNYAWIGVGRDDGKNAGEFSPLFFDTDRWKVLRSGTFWLSSTPNIPSKGWDAALPRICTWAIFVSKVYKREILVMNTHFDHVGEEARQMSSKLVLKCADSLAESRPVVVMGDLNSDPQSKVYSILTNSTFQDAYSASAVRYGPVGTFNGFDYLALPKARIDYVFFSQPFLAKTYSVDSRIIDGRYLSDHFPVIVTLNIP